MKVIVASFNPVKLNAVKAAFGSQFAKSSIKVTGCEVASGVADQPLSDDETLRGARNRVANARESQPAADFWVGLEGGVERGPQGLVAFAWMVIQAADGRQSEIRSVGLPLPPAVGRLMDEGLELGDANDQVFATTNSKQGGGAFGLLTNGLLTRESVYQQTLILALVPFVHPLFEAAAY